MPRHNATKILPKYYSQTKLTITVTLTCWFRCTQLSIRQWEEIL